MGLAHKDWNLGGFSTPKGFGPIVTKMQYAWFKITKDKETMFQYPEGFWPDSDSAPVQ